MFGRYVFSFLLFFSISKAMSQGTMSQISYHHLLQEGKVWNYQLNYMDNEFNFHTCLCRDWIEGDTIIDGKTFYRMFSIYSETYDTPLVRYLHEDNGKVFFWGNGCLDLVYDFTLSSGESIPCEGFLSVGPDFYVKSVDDINVRGSMRKRLNINSAYGPCTCWVEGVGCPDRIDEPLGHLVSDGRIYTLLSCWVGDECIFDKEDFNVPASTESIKTSSLQTRQSEIHDLQGRTLPQRPAKGIYIQNGQKRLSK